jgi:hypothetical protein
MNAKDEVKSSNVGFFATHHHEEDHMTALMRRYGFMNMLRARVRARHGV